MTLIARAGTMTVLLVAGSIGRALGFHNWERAELPNGVAVSVVERSDTPTVALTLLVRAGATADPPGKRGLAWMTGELLRDGTATRNSREISERILELGGRFEEHVGFDDTILRMAVLKEDLEPAMEFLSDLVRRPSFPERRFAEARRQIEATARQHSLTREELVLQQLFADTKYGALVSPARDSIDKIVLQDLRRFHRAFYRPAHTVLTAAGDVRLETLRPLALRYLGDWSSESVEGDAVPESANSMSRPSAPRDQPLVIDHPSAQATVVLAFVSPSIGTHDGTAARVLVQALAGGEESRVGLNLRKKRAWVYSVSGWTEEYLGTGILWIQMSVPNDQAMSALEETWHEIDAVMKRSLSDAELERAKERARFNFYTTTDTLDGISRALGENELRTRGTKRPDQIVDEIDAVGPSDVLRAASLYLSRDRSAVVVEGDARAIHLTTATGESR